MKVEDIYITNGRCYTLEEAERELRHRVSNENWASLLSHISRPDTAWAIDGFLEYEGELYLWLGDEWHSPGLIVC